MPALTVSDAQKTLNGQLRLSSERQQSREVGLTASLALNLGQEKSG
jgi:hypothetical protein